MQTTFDNDVEDVQKAVSMGRDVRAHGPYRILVGDERLQFVGAVIADPVPTGTQILAAAGVTQPVEHLLFRMLVNGLLEEIRPEETTDLRSSGAEKFLVFRNDRSFRFQLDDRAYDWGAAQISGATLKRLALQDLPTHDVWLETPSGSDRPIGDTELVDLGAPGVERFVTRPISITIVVNARQRQLHQRRVSYWDIVKLAYPEAVPSENIIYTVNYGRGPASNPEGSMAEGQSVQIKEGMTFYVTPTDKS
jgi:hypothetical protein